MNTCVHRGLLSSVWSRHIPLWINILDGWWQVRDKAARHLIFIPLSNSLQGLFLFFHVTARLCYVGKNFRSQYFSKSTRHNGIWWFLSFSIEMTRLQVFPWLKFVIAQTDRQTDQNWSSKLSFVYFWPRIFCRISRTSITKLWKNPNVWLLFVSKTDQKLKTAIMVFTSVCKLLFTTTYDDEGFDYCSVHCVLWML